MFEEINREGQTVLMVTTAPALPVFPEGDSSRTARCSTSSTEADARAKNSISLFPTPSWCSWREGSKVNNTSCPFYAKLALTSIRKNKSIYAPYLLASTLLAGLYYTLSSVTYMVLKSDMHGADAMGFILSTSSGICGALSLVVLFYVNSFVMKQRKREFGLYGILGMEKRHISLVVLCEVLFAGAISILAALWGRAAQPVPFWCCCGWCASPRTHLSGAAALGARSPALSGRIFRLCCSTMSSDCRPTHALLHRERRRAGAQARWCSRFWPAALGGGYITALLCAPPRCGSARYWCLDAGDRGHLPAFVAAASRC
jgi:hypothetical protein